MGEEVRKRVADLEYDNQKVFSKCKKLLDQTHRDDEEKRKKIDSLTEQLRTATNGRLPTETEELRRRSSDGGRDRQADDSLNVPSQEDLENAVDSQGDSKGKRASNS